ncbi:MAG: phosphotransferase [Caldilineaceae bacterium]|nr:phosphotransferase [Caldilineaceae bacterium]
MEDQQAEQLVKRIHPRARLLRRWKLPGGVSAQVTALALTFPNGKTQKLVIRQHGEADLERNPKIAHDEFRLLQILRSAGVAAPHPIYLEESGEISPIPLLVEQYIEGEPVLSPLDLDDFLHQIAAHLTSIHRIEETNWDLSFLPKQTSGWGNRPAQLDESLAEGKIRCALEALWPLAKGNDAVLLHGDYWPGNLLWQDGQLAAVIDWEDAAVGDPLADVANSRLEILWALGVEAMEQFTENYQTLMRSVDFTNLPYWDLCAALRPASKLSTWGLESATESAMRAAHQRFTDQALAQLQ